MPVSILTSVDLPAPFSPTSAVTSPARKVSPTLCSARTPGKLLETPRSDSTGVASAVSDDRRNEGSDRIDSRPELGGSRACVLLVRQARDDDQKIFANFSMFDLSKVNGSAIAASPSAPILMSPMRPAWIVVPGLPVALPSAMSAAIMVAV